MNWAEHLDQLLLLRINGAHHPWLDEIFWFVSLRITWIPLYIGLFYLIYRKKGLKIAGIVVLAIVCTVILVDVTSSYLIKETVMRYRPSHHLILGSQLHFYEQAPGHWYKGGQYGFVSSHAANFMAICTCFYLWMRPAYRNITWLLLLLACVIGYSRIYLGVHYPSDVFGGFVLGALLSWILYRFAWKKLLPGTLFES